MLDEDIAIQCVSSESDSVSIVVEDVAFTPLDSGSRLVSNRSLWVQEGEKALRMVAAQNEGQRIAISKTIRVRCDSVLEFIKSTKT